MHRSPDRFSQLRSPLSPQNASRGLFSPANRWPFWPCTQASRCMAALQRTDGLLCPMQAITAAATCDHRIAQPCFHGMAARPAELKHCVTLNKEVLGLILSMSVGGGGRSKAHQRNATVIRAQLAPGQQVVMFSHMSLTAARWRRQA